MVKKLFQKFAAKVMDVDDTEKPVSQMRVLRDFLSKHRYDYSDNMEENLQMLKRKHMVDSFVVTNKDGSTVVSSDGNGHMEGIVGTAMYSYVKSELPDSESVLVKKGDGWFMLFSVSKKIFIVKAGSELSNVELKALSSEISSMIPPGKKAEREISRESVAQ